MVEDATQDTLLTLHIRRHTYEPGRPFRAWLCGIARYKWIDRLRALERDPAAPCAEDISEDIAVDDHGPAIMSALLLRELLSQLKSAQSEVIRLVKLEGLSIEEAAERTGQSASLVKVNMHRGLARLSSIAAAEGAVVALGVTVDDLADHRPGQRAARERQQQQRYS